MIPLQSILMSSLSLGEARAVALLLLERVCGFSQTDVLMGKADSLPCGQQLLLQEMAQRVANGEPVQYVVSVEDFCGLTLHVEPGVLIPRPETEELVNRTVERMKAGPRGDILDIGTGSGCIALALKHRMADVRVEAWDVSRDALRIAAENARLLNLDIDFRCRDVLMEEVREVKEVIDSDTAQQEGRYALIISNPPYVCRAEAADMEPNVLAHEPHLALFVPDDDPLLFYRSIASFARRHLVDDGRLHFEINRRFGHEIVSLLQSLGFDEVELQNDQFEQPRYIFATWKTGGPTPSPSLVGRGVGRQEGKKTRRLSDAGSVIAQ